MTRTVEDITLVDHACTLPDSDEHLWEVTAAWIATGLAAGDRVVYFEDDTAEFLLNRLADDQVQVSGALADGQLVIVPTAATRSLLDAPVEQLEQAVAGQLHETTAQGWPGLRLSGESGGALLGPGGGMHRIIDIENVLGRMLKGHPSARLLCRYPRHRFDDAALATLRGMHDTELVSPAVYDDTLLRITSLGPAAARLAGEVDHSNRPRLRNLIDTTLDQALRSHSSPTDIVLDLASLRFLDVAGAVSLVHAAEEFPSSHRLVLAHVNPRVVRVLDRCGAPFAAQLVLQPRSIPARATAVQVPVQAAPEQVTLEQVAR